MDPRAAIELIVGAVREAPSVRALFLSGSYGAGLEDKHSDIDFLAVSTDGATEGFAALWREAVGKTGEIVLWWGHFKSNLITAYTSDWLRVDVEILTPDQMAKRSQSGLKVLFDHDGTFGTLPESLSKSGPNSQMMRRQFESFIRILGLMALGIGRPEYEVGVTGVFHLRTHLLDLLVEETAAPNRGGALHLSRLITDEQKQLLAALPAIRPEREALITTSLAYAKAYLPRARRLAKRLGIDWPERLEAAAWANLKKELGVERPYVPE